MLGFFKYLRYFQRIYSIENMKKLGLGVLRISLSQMGRA